MTGVEIDLLFEAALPVGHVAVSVDEARHYCLAGRVYPFDRFAARDVGGIHVRPHGVDSVIADQHGRTRQG